MTARHHHSLPRNIAGLASSASAQDCLSQSDDEALPELLQQLGMADLQAPAKLATVSQAYTVDQACLARLTQAIAPPPPSLANAVLKRQVEFAAGRWCGTQALRQLGYLGAAEIGIAAHRSPCWPNGYLGSISHSQGWAVAIVGLRADSASHIAHADTPCLQGIGIDVETILPNITAQSLARRVAINSELALGAPHGLPFETWVSLLFSGKESLFKALYPSVGRYFHFHDAVVDALDLAQAQFSLRLVQNLSAQHTLGQRYRIQFALGQQRLVTRCLVTEIVARRLSNASDEWRMD